MLYSLRARPTSLEPFFPSFEVEIDVPGFFDEFLRPMTINVEISVPDRSGNMYPVARGILESGSWEA